jgi:hypothetical protein
MQCRDARVCVSTDCSHLQIPFKTMPIPAVRIPRYIIRLVIRASPEYLEVRGRFPWRSLDCISISNSVNLKSLSLLGAASVSKPNANKASPAVNNAEPKLCVAYHPPSHQTKPTTIRIAHSRSNPSLTIRANEFARRVMVFICVSARTESGRVRAACSPRSTFRTRQACR